MERGMKRYLCAEQLCQGYKRTSNSNYQKWSDCSEGKNVEMDSFSGFRNKSWFPSRIIFSYIPKGY